MGSCLLPAAAWSAGAPGQVESALRDFGSLPGATSGLVACESAEGPWRAGIRPDAVLFVGSAVKTFILAECLRAAEAGRLSENDAWAIDDTVRSPSSPVFLELSGATPARSVLEAMITHSDNTATDAALARATPGRVRALIAEAGLTNTRIPDSTRRLFSYLAGAPDGVDLGWAGMEKMKSGWMPGPPRSPMNDRQAMVSTASEMVRWYQQSLAGQYFTKPETLTEYRRIQAMADSLSKVAPPDALAWGKGGSIDWERFHCFSLPGQMIVNGRRATFCFTINWTGPDDGIGATFEKYRASVASVLKAVAANRTG